MKPAERGRGILNSEVLLGYIIWRLQSVSLGNMASRPVRAFGTFLPLRSFKQFFGCSTLSTPSPPLPPQKKEKNNQPQAPCASALECFMPIIVVLVMKVRLVMACVLSCPVGSPLHALNPAPGIFGGLCHVETVIQHPTQYRLQSGPGHLSFQAHERGSNETCPNPGQ